MNDRVYYSREAEERAQREKIAAVLIFLAMGVIIGTAIALLFAPQSGKRTRREIAHSVEDSIEEGLEATASTVRRLEKEFAELRKRVESGMGRRRW